MSVENLQRALIDAAYKSSTDDVLEDEALTVQKFPGIHNVDKMDMLELLEKVFADQLITMEYDGPLLQPLRKIIKNKPPNFRNLRDYIRCTKQDISKYNDILDKVGELLAELKSEKGEQQATELENEDADIVHSFIKKILKMLGIKKLSIEKGKSHGSEKRRKKSKDGPNLRAVKRILRGLLASEQEDLQIAVESIKSLREEIRYTVQKKHPELEAWLDKLTTTEVLCWSALVTYFKVTPTSNLLKEAKLSKSLAKDGSLLFKLKARLISECDEALQRGASYGYLKTHIPTRERQQGRNQGLPEPTMGDY